MMDEEKRVYGWESESVKEEKEEKEEEGERERRTMERAERGRRGKEVPEMDLLYFILIYSRFFCIRDGNWRVQVSSPDPPHNTPLENCGMVWRVWGLLLWYLLWSLPTHSLVPMSPPQLSVCVDLGTRPRL